MIHSTAWRKLPDRLSEAGRAINDPAVIGMLAVLELDHPARQRVPLRDGFDATMRLGLIDGFQMCLDMFRNLAEPMPMQPESLKATWGVPEEENEPKSKS